MTSSSNGVGNAQTIASHPRHAYTRAILGEELFTRLSSAKVLVVGAGGIGCELLKTLALVGVGNIEVIDLDTIDLSNLNRQFLFTKAHISKPKSLIASTTARSFNPLVHITPFHANVKDTTQFGWEYFLKFDVVCNALDNLEARRWVNRMCIMTGVPLVESGTTGFLGQVQPIMKGVTECYDCTTKPIVRTFPTCTLRSTPSIPAHCIVWAKTWLMEQLFGAEDETEDAELEKALQGGEKPDLIATLRKEAGEMGAIRSAVTGIPENATEEETRSVCRRLFDKLFKEDIERLLRMEDMWRKRTKPIPIQYDTALSEQSNGNGNGSTSSILEDQKLLSLRETVQLFDESLLALVRRAQKNPGTPILFDKDDIDTLNFVTASSNLRSRIYHIEPQTRFQAKQIAGNIIPAIASTNAIIAGAQVFQLLQALKHAWKDARFVSLNKMNATRLVTSFACGKPNIECAVCQDDYARANVDLDKVTLGQFKEAVLKDRKSSGLGYRVDGVEIFEAVRLLADEDFDDNLQRTLKDLGIEDGKIITCVDEDGIRANIHIMVTCSSSSTSSVDVDFGPVYKLPVLRSKTKTTKAAVQSDDDDDDIVEMAEMPQAPSAAKRKRDAPEDEVNGKANGTEAEEASSKRKKVAASTGNDEEQAIELD